MKWGLTKRNETKLNPFEAFERDVKRIFDDFFTLEPVDLFDSAWVPSIDVEEDEKSIHVRAEIPGIDEKDLNVTLEDNVLTISGEKKEERKEENKRYVLAERRFGSFKRSIALPAEVKADNVKASFKNGVLTVDFEKKEVSQPKRITINVK
ncbi:MAG TPA: Hsp20/alpha crystallin family protein [Spirochaetota bacterium]|nr:Hsp20/alpha crystallin family protein [Spirochaetota bacterium]HOM11084.1 Hsp20/alpha crystallin family protein [Spirochaetota bacterium]HPP51026.1 Hsp20/alpha crystallin family protein [Spirochaetota bacterium]HXK66004.1 Hsp20/alpha crystallin family protein [Spirochaetota bacterium]